MNQKKRSLTTHGTNALYDLASSTFSTTSSSPSPKSTVFGNPSLLSMTSSSSKLITAKYSNTIVKPSDTTLSTATSSGTTLTKPSKATIARSTNNNGSKETLEASLAVLDKRSTFDFASYANGDDSSDDSEDCYYDDDIIDVDIDKQVMPRANQRQVYETDEDEDNETSYEDDDDDSTDIRTQIGLGDFFEEDPYITTRTSSRSGDDVKNTENESHAVATGNADNGENLRNSSVFLVDWPSLTSSSNSTGAVSHRHDTSVTKDIRAPSPLLRSSGLSVVRKTEYNYSYSPSLGNDDSKEEIITKIKPKPNKLNALGNGHDGADFSHGNEIERDQGAFNQAMKYPSAFPNPPPPPPLPSLAAMLARQSTKRRNQSSKNYSLDSSTDGGFSFMSRYALSDDNNTRSHYHSNSKSDNDTATTVQVKNGNGNGFENNGIDTDEDTIVADLDLGIQDAVVAIRHEASKVNAAIALDQVESIKHDLHCTKNDLHERISEMEELRSVLQHKNQRLSTLELERDLYLADADKLRHDLDVCLQKIHALEQQSLQQQQQQQYWPIQMPHPPIYDQQINYPSQQQHIKSLSSSGNQGLPWSDSLETYSDRTKGVVESTFEHIGLNDFKLPIMDNNALDVSKRCEVESADLTCSRPHHANDPYFKEVKRSRLGDKTHIHLRSRFDNSGQLNGMVSQSPMTASIALSSEFSFQNVNFDSPQDGVKRVLFTDGCTTLNLDEAIDYTKTTSTVSKNSLQNDDAESEPPSLRIHPQQLEATITVPSSRTLASWLNHPTASASSNSSATTASAVDTERENIISSLEGSSSFSTSSFSSTLQHQPLLSSTTLPKKKVKKIRQPNSDSSSFVSSDHPSTPFLSQSNISTGSENDGMLIQSSDSNTIKSRSILEKIRLPRRSTLKRYSKPKERSNDRNNGKRDYAPGQRYWNEYPESFSRKNCDLGSTSDLLHNKLQQTTNIDKSNLPIRQGLGSSLSIGKTEKFTKDISAKVGTSSDSANKSKSGNCLRGRRRRKRRSPEIEIEERQKCASSEDKQRKPLSAVLEDSLRLHRELKISQGQLRLRLARTHQEQSNLLNDIERLVRNMKLQCGERMATIDMFHRTSIEQLQTTIHERDEEIMLIRSVL